MSPEKPINKRDSPTVVSLFSGAGGLDLGLAAAGFEIVFESDVDPFSCETLEANGEKTQSMGNVPAMRNAVVSPEDVRNLDAETVRRLANLGDREIDLLAGGPPCQSFSVFGKRRGVSDSRGGLIFEYCRMLQDLRPRAFVMENVYGMLSVQGGRVFEEVLDALRGADDTTEYEVTWIRVNAQDFGVPQSRDRVFIFGARRDLLERPALKVKMKPLCEDPSLLSSGLPLRTVADGLKGLPSHLENPPTISNHRGRKHGPEVVSRYGALRPGERDSRTRINRLDSNRPSFTIVVGSDAGGGKGHVHPFEARELTPRESARLQTFPDWWEFSGNVRHEIRQVGNAVPPLLGFAVGNAVRKYILGRRPISLRTGVKRLSQEHLFSPEELQAGRQAKSLELAA